MNMRRYVVLGVLLSATLPAEAGAHFLFVRVGPPAERGRRVEVFFSEQADAGDPQFVAKIAHTRLWAQTAPGEFREMRPRAAEDRLIARAPGAAGWSA